MEITRSVIEKDGAEGWVLLLQAGTAKRQSVILDAAKAKGF